MAYDRQQDDKSRGAMFPRTKRTQNSPDTGGEITLRGDVLGHILANAESGEVELRITGWRRQANSGTPMTSLLVEIPQEQGGYQPRQTSQGNYGNRQVYNQRGNSQRPVQQSHNQQRQTGPAVRQQSMNFPQDRQPGNSYASQSRQQEPRYFDDPRSDDINPWDD